MPRFVVLPLLFFAAIAAASCNAAGATPDKAGDFDIGTYQSAGVLGDQTTSLQAVLDRGQPVVLNFWGGDCPPCRAEMPTLEDAWQEHGADIVMLGVDIGPMFGLGTIAQGQQLLLDTEVTYPAGNSQDGSILSDYNLNALPATFFVLPDGTVNDSWIGSIASGQLHRRINDLVEAAN